MTNRRSFTIAAAFLATALLAGCATQTKMGSRDSGPTSFWQGRLSVRVQALPGQVPTQERSFSTAFELQGNASRGDLVLLTPLGSTAAAIHWHPDGAVLHARGETQTFSDLAQLVQTVLGTDVPVTALFAWLAGRAQEADGWQVDLSHQPQGKIVARRTAPALPAELQVLLDH